MIIRTFQNGDELHHYQKSLVTTFAGHRKVISTAPYNGGIKTDLRAVFNNDCKPGEGMACELKAPSYDEHMALLSEELGISREECAGISTAASMENVSIKTKAFKEVEVTAVVTGGIENNGGRAGDPAFWHEEKGESVYVKPGTINIMLHINTDLSEGALTRALVTCTEAKTAALGELMASSRYSMGIATGSGTDGTIIICDSESDILLTQAGKHSKLGELIGVAVIEALKEALEKQSGLNPNKQHSILRRMDRFQVTEETLWNGYVQKGGNLDKPHFLHQLHILAVEDEIVTYTSLYAHLLDQLNWKLLSVKEIVPAAEALLELMGKRPSDPMDWEKEQDISETVKKLRDSYEHMILEML